MAAKKRRRRKSTAKKRNLPTNKKLYARVKAKTKRKFAVYPSAYANAYLVREYKKAGGRYRRGEEKETYQKTNKRSSKASSSSHEKTYEVYENTNEKR